MNDYVYKFYCSLQSDYDLKIVTIQLVALRHLLQ
jgi:hypothetical protein